jgi:hypothetical protein
MEKLTIHRALSELKILEDRIFRQINESNPIGFKQPNKLVSNFYQETDFIKDATSNHQSIIALIERKNKIKSAISKINSITLVTIGNKQMTISDAISYKSNINLMEALISKYKTCLAKTKQEFNLLNEKVETIAISLAEKALQKDNVKIGDKDASNIIDPYIKNNKCSLVDPLKLEELIKNMENDKEAFMSEVDAVLSEINAITFIEI